jgi:hypothetical protein
MRKYWLSTLLVVPLALIFSACSSNGGTQPAAGAGGSGANVSAGAQAPAGSTAPTSASTTAPKRLHTPAPSRARHTPSTGTHSTSNTAALPNYQPSTVVSQAGGHTQLTSPDDVSKLTAFYQNALQQGGWSISSSAKTTASTNLIAHRTGQGVTIAISNAGPAGTSISISTYRQ